MTEESPWTTFDIAINLVILGITLGIAIFMLVLKAAWLYLGIWIAMVLLYIFLGRYVTCRHCDYLGKPCPSWCMGIIGGLLYKRSEKKNFCEDGILNLFLFDVLFLIIAMLLPIIVYVIQLMTIGLLTLDWFLFSIYIILVLVTLGTHSLTGCRKCPIEDCPMASKK